MAGAGKISPKEIGTNTKSTIERRSVIDALMTRK
jgi:hypothetical protein